MRSEEEDMEDWCWDILKVEVGFLVELGGCCAWRERGSSIHHALGISSNCLFPSSILSNKSVILCESRQHSERWWITALGCVCVWLRYALHQEASSQNRKVKLRFQSGEYNFRYSLDACPLQAVESLECLFYFFKEIDIKKEQSSGGGVYFHVPWDLDLDLDVFEKMFSVWLNSSITTEGHPGVLPEYPSQLPLIHA